MTEIIDQVSNVVTVVQETVTGTVPTGTITPGQSIGEGTANTMVAYAENVDCSDKEWLASAALEAEVNCIKSSL